MFGDDIHIAQRFVKASQLDLIHATDRSDFVSSPIKGTFGSSFCGFLSERVL